jgi:hypothetical protein
MTFDDTSAWAWKLPTAVQALFSGLVLAGCFVIPESPRYLMNQGREDEAREFLVHYHGNDKSDHVCNNSIHYAIQ